MRERRRRLLCRISLPPGFQIDARAGAIDVLKQQPTAQQGNKVEQHVNMISSKKWNGLRPVLDHNLIEPNTQPMPKREGTARYAQLSTNEGAELLRQKRLIALTRQPPRCPKKEEQATEPSADTQYAEPAPQVTSYWSRLGCQGVGFHTQL